MFDWQGSGPKARQTLEDCERAVESSLAINGWPNNRAACIIIDPEIEIWAWGNPTSMWQIVTASGAAAHKNRRLSRIKRQFDKFNRISNPKEVIERRMQRVGIVADGGLYRKLGMKTPMEPCSDRAMQKFRDTLQAWFP